MGSRCGVPLLLALVVFSCTSAAAAAVLPKTGLQRQFYKKTNTCDDAEEFIKHQVGLFWQKDRSITPKLVRLLYTDCFVTGCDASILLDSKPNSERTAPQNSGIGGMVFIDRIKSVLEQRCKGVVSCADILNLATRDAVHLAGAPSYPVLTGRRDGFVSTAASVDLPSPSVSWASSLAYFESKGLNELDMVTLLGAHSMGSTHCRYILDRLYKRDQTFSMDPALVAQLKKKCPPKTQKGQGDPLVFLNEASGERYNFTNSYYTNVIHKRGVLGIDQKLLSTSDSIEITNLFAAGFEDFRKAWAVSMTRMGSIGVLTVTQGEIRRNCHYTNKDNPNH